MDIETINRFIQYALQAPRVAVDTETTGIEKIKTGQDYLTGISMAFPVGGLGMFKAYFPLRHKQDNLSIPEVLPKIKTVLAEKPLTFHNRKFDHHSLKTIGIDPDKDLNKDQHCTLIMAHLWNEELPSKELDWLSKVLLKRPMPAKDKVGAFAKAFGWDNIPPHLIEGRACEDAEATYLLDELLWERLRGQELTNLWPGERDFGSILYRMEQRGVGVNLDFAQRKVEQGSARMDAIEHEIGFDLSSRADLSNFFFDELGLPVLKRSPKTGKPSLDKFVMEEYDEMLAGQNNPAAKLVLEWRGWQKAITSLYTPILEKVDLDGKIRTNYKQHGTKTGRLSSAGPNLQQIPRKTDKVWNGDAKKCFDSGNSEVELIGYDYAQLEFRLAVAYGKVKRLLDEFEKPDGDVFQVMADDSGAPRQTIKTFTYASLYGAGLPKIAATMGKHPSDVEPMYVKFLESIDGIRKASRRATELAGDRGFVRYWNGRRRHFSNTEEDAHKAFNSILQGGGAELVKEAQRRCAELESPECQMVMQVHDEIVFAIEKGKRDKYEPEIIERMTNFPEFGVHFAVEGKVWNQ